jgi:hypothetical protein
MKKTYFAPNTRVVRVKLHQMIAGSPTPQTLSIENIETNPVSSSDDIGSRRSSSIWDD